MKKIISIFLCLALLFSVSTTAWAVDIKYRDVTVYIGEYRSPVTFYWDDDNKVVVWILLSELPGGLERHIGANRGLCEIKGTALPGTARTYDYMFDWYTSDGESGRASVGKIIVEIGPQTIAPYNNSQVHLGETITLTPHSTNGNGVIIPADSTHAPTYAFTSSDSGVATVDPATGVVTPVSIGTATITISSAATESYRAAVDVTADVEVLPSRLCDITSFSINGVQGVISGNTITVTLPYGTDVTNLAPVIAVSPGASVSPVSGVPQDFTAPVTYTVTAQNGVTNTYTVNVVLGPQPQPKPQPQLEAQPASAGQAESRVVNYEKAVIGNCKEWVNVRSGAGDGYDIIGKAYLGETIELLEWNRGETWCKVIYNGGNNVGWVYGKFIIVRK